MQQIVINIDPIIIKIFGMIVVVFLSLIGYFLNRMIKQFDRGIAEIKEVKQTITDLSGTIRVYGEKTNNHNLRLDKLEEKVDKIITEHHGFRRGSHL